MTNGSPGVGGTVSGPAQIDVLRSLAKAQAAALDASVVGGTVAGGLGKKAPLGHPGNRCQGRC